MHPTFPLSLQVAQGYGAHGITVTRPEENLQSAIAEAQRVATGPNARPVLLNVHIGKTDFREGSLSV